MTEAVVSTRRGVRARQAGAVLGLLVLIGALVGGSDLFGVRESLFGSATLIGLGGTYTT